MGVRKCRCLSIFDFSSFFPLKFSVFLQHDVFYLFVYIIQKGNTISHHEILYEMKSYARTTVHLQYIGY